MGAFDGIRIPYDKGYPTTDFKLEYNHFSTQSSFNFFKGFGIEELRKLLAEAEHDKCDKVYVPHERGPGWGHIGLRTWYVRALIEEHFGKKET